MIHYGVCIGDEDRYQRCAGPGLARVAARSRVIESRGNKSIFRAYNQIIDRALQDPEMEALVLLHEDTELRDDAFESKVRAELADSEVAVLGVVGGRESPSSRWWEGERFGYAPDNHHPTGNDFGKGRHDVDQVDGLLLVLSRWAVENLRFDERFRGFHVYDADMCMQARAAGRIVRVVDIELFHHDKGSRGDEAAYHRMDSAYRRKWGLPLPPWKVRILRERPAAKRLRQLLPR